MGWILFVGFDFVHSPGVAETLDMRDERETFGFLTKKARVSQWLRIFDERVTNAYVYLAERNTNSHHLSLSLSLLSPLSLLSLGR